MKKIIIFISLIFFLFVVISVYSQEPTPTPREDSQNWQSCSTKTDKNGNTHQYCTQKVPLLIKEVESKGTNPDANKQRQDVDQESSTKKIIDIVSIAFTAISTLAIAIFTLFLVCYNKKMWKTTIRSVEATEIAAKAAKESAEALPAIERAYVFVEVEYGCKNPKPHDVDYFANALYGKFRDFNFQVILHNHGKTPAIVSHVRYSIIKSDRVPKTEADLIGSEYRNFEPCIIIESGGVYCKEINHELAEEEWKQIWGKNKLVLCLVQITYVDIFSIQHNTTFFVDMTLRKIISLLPIPLLMSGHDIRK
jgi:hypothetical protein